MLNNENKPQEKRLTTFIKYSATGFQMLATIGVFAFIGYKIDEKRGSEKPVFMAILGVIGAVVSLYQVVRSLSKEK